MAWNVQVRGKAAKAIAELPERYRLILVKLMRDLEILGPVRGDWPNYSKLGGERHHCHLRRKGKPTYVACWQTVDKEHKILEVYYVGTREKAPY